MLESKLQRSLGLATTAFALGAMILACGGSDSDELREDISALQTQLQAGSSPSPVVATSSPGNSPSPDRRAEDDWASRYLAPVQGRVNQASFGPAQAMLAFESCSGTACDAALATLLVELQNFAPVLESAIADLNKSPSAPARVAEIRDIYKAYLQLRLDAVRLYIPGLERRDAAVLTQADLKWAEATAKSGEMVAKLQQFSQADAK